MASRTPAGPVTMEDVAREAGVSRAAVSKVIRDAHGVSAAMRERVTTAIATLGYRPNVSARGMRGATYTLGIEIPELANPFFPRLLAGVTAAVSASPYQLIVAPADPANVEGYRAIQALVDRQVDGVIAVSPLVEPAWLEALAATVPVVMLGRHDRASGYDTVANDDEAGTRQAMRHLIDLGHRDIAHLTCEETKTVPGSGVPQAIRLETYREVMRESGLDAHIRVVRTPTGEAGACRTATRLLTGPERPTAIFASHDEPALGVQRAIAEAGLTPMDVSVVGYDDIEIARHPGVSLTTVNQDGERIGRLAAELLLERIAGRTEPRQEIVRPELVVRSSTRPPP
ncbi:LacI family DNA-binding transcriptional regulator [Stackebrandtia nassauensis]|uniref:Transcriptional regulator, LacI family n=1 Tax=Stackebrandtia nassauensis (strain DSM 44728 / CIP 108903 / NRRL B-16338 / NBRC 102104 / LLR-40K-21) TaxID=446470 RepID=D3Q8H7_STANL|nr:LacI family DNA-binding transcriptional regulator [Stackebrandtia nassauensis]ADD42551.1 transcriptional regulator, LacI family [Stackebrandtia nassauensis DSM 44728]